MNQNPKKIWMAADDAFQEYCHQFDGDIGYIRADVVDELVEALKDMHKTQLNNNKHDPDDYKNTKQCLRVEAALAKLEDSHD